MSAFIDVISEIVFDKLKVADDSCMEEAVYFSRDCVGCGSHSTHAYTACGHAVCRDCADDADGANDTCQECPECGKRNAVVKLDESLFRGCGVCQALNPRFRDAFSGCGHVICSGCCVDNDFSASYNDCPLCKQVSGRFSLVEKSDFIPEDAFPKVLRGSDLFDDAIAQFEHEQLQKEQKDREAQKQKEEEERVAQELREKQESEAKLNQSLKIALEKLQKKKDQQVFEDRLKWALEQRKMEERKRQEEEMRRIQEEQQCIPEWLQEAESMGRYVRWENHYYHHHHQFAPRQEMVFYM